MELRMPGIGPVQILQGLLPDRDLPLYLVDAPEHFCREGNPYTDVSGRDWGDNPERFLLFSRVIALWRMGCRRSTGARECCTATTGRPACAGLAARSGRAPGDGLHHPQPGLPGAVRPRHLRPAAIAGRALVRRAGSSFTSACPSSRAASSSPTASTPSARAMPKRSRPSARLRPRRLLRQLGGRFSGILNGIDYQEWNPASDPALPQTYDAEHIHLKAENKLELQRLFGLPRNEHAFVLGYVGRLVEQKGST
jgi:starch synthase